MAREARNVALAHVAAWTLRASGLLIAALPFAPPLLRLAGWHQVADPLDALWENSCHRLPERTLALGGELMPLCSRCLGLVVGLGLGLFVAAPYRDVRTLRVTVSIAVAFLFVELTTQDLGWHPVFHPTRLLSGFAVAFPIGAAAGALAVAVAREHARLARSPG